MSYLVFSQAASLVVDEHPLVHKARLFFNAELTFPERRYTGEGPSARARLVLSLTLYGREQPVLFPVVVRPATDDDRQAAREAEIAGRAGGMAQLAARCPHVWQIDAPEDDPEATHTLCGVLAAVLLGPVLPPDHSTLYGVRGARERAEKSAK